MALTLVSHCEILLYQQKSTKIWDTHQIRLYVLSATIYCILHTHMYIYIYVCVCVCVVCVRVCECAKTKEKNYFAGRDRRQSNRLAKMRSIAVRYATKQLDRMEKKNLVTCCSTVCYILTIIPPAWNQITCWPNVLLKLIWCMIHKEHSLFNATWHYFN